MNIESNRTIESNTSKICNKLKNSSNFKNFKKKKGDETELFKSNKKRYLNPKVFQSFGVTPPNSNKKNNFCFPFSKIEPNSREPIIQKKSHFQSFNLNLQDQPIDNYIHDFIKEFRMESSLPSNDSLPPDSLRLSNRDFFEKNMEPFLNCNSTGIDFLNVEDTEKQKSQESIQMGSNMKQISTIYEESEQERLDESKINEENSPNLEQSGVKSSSIDALVNKMREQELEIIKLKQNVEVLTQENTRLNESQKSCDRCNHLENKLFTKKNEIKNIKKSFKIKEEVSNYKLWHFVDHLKSSRWPNSSKKISDHISNLYEVSLKLL